MVIYRPHCGGLAEAMAEAREFESFEDMKRYIYEQAEDFNGIKPFEIEDIVVADDLHEDWRVGWNDSRHVGIKRYFNEDYMKKYGVPQCVGQCATDYPGLEGSIKKMWEFLTANFDFQNLDRNRTNKIKGE